jgi:hypothetical protein
MNESTGGPLDTSTPASVAVDEREIEPADPRALGDRIQKAVKSRGWIRVAGPRPLSEFEQIGASLGEIELRTDIVVDAARDREQRKRRLHQPSRPGVYTAAALELHTDRPTAAMLGWYCVEPDVTGGATQLVDTRPLLAEFSTDELAALGRVRVGHAQPDPETREEVLYHAPLVARRGGEWEVFYVPWFVEPPEDEAARLMLERFQRLVEQERRRGLLEIVLKRGQCLFVDNRRMLHGRGPLPEDSRRHLVRLYIRGDRWDSPSSAPGA